MRRVLLALLLVVVGMATPAQAAQAAQTIGFPTFGGPSIPAAPGNSMQAIYDAESSGTDFWMDRLLARPGNDPAGTWLMSRGRAVFMKTHDPAVLGFGGQVAYWESISDQNAYSVAITPGTFTEQVSQRWQAPSHWKSVHTSGSITVNQTKFVTENNVAVTNLSIVNNGASSATLQLRAVSPYATSGSGGELTGQVNVKNNLTTVYPRLTGDGFTASGGGLNRSVTVAPGATVTAKVVMGLVTTEIPESSTEYTAYAGYSNATAFATHVRAYNLWWAQNIPYIDVPEPAIKKNIYYRWVSVPGQVKSPGTPRANYNVVQFPAVSAQRVRMLATAASGARTGLTELKIFNRGGVQPPANQALSATPTASYTSAWESVAAINDGVDPPSSNDTVNPRWGCWPETGQQWVDLTWSSAKSLSKAEVYFFDDDEGIDMPASWTLQYWNGSAYVDVPGASAYTLSKNQYNPVTFAATSTTRLRVLLTANGSNSVGLLEVKAY